MTTTLATIREAPGLDAYLEELEERLEDAVGDGSVVAAVGNEALTARAVAEDDSGDVPMFMRLFLAVNRNLSQALKAPTNWAYDAFL